MNYHWFIFLRFLIFLKSLINLLAVEHKNIFFFLLIPYASKQYLFNYLTHYNILEITSSIFLKYIFRCNGVGFGKIDSYLYSKFCLVQLLSRVNFKFFDCENVSIKCTVCFKSFWNLNYKINNPLTCFTGA